MQPIFFTVGTKLPLMVVPNSQAHMDGHPVLTYTYNVYRDKQNGHGELPDAKESDFLLEEKNDPDYFGYITFELPGKLFTYTADGKEELSSDEVQEIIEQINHYRDTPSMWEI